MENITDAIENYVIARINAARALDAARDHPSPILRKSYESALRMVEDYKTKMKAAIRKEVEGCSNKSACCSGNN